MKSCLVFQVKREEKSVEGERGGLAGGLEGGGGREGGGGGEGDCTGVKVEFDVCVFFFFVGVVVWSAFYSVMSRSILSNLVAWGAQGGWERRGLHLDISQLDVRGWGLW